MKPQSSRFETATGATFHRAQSCPGKLVGGNWQGFTKPQDKSKGKRSIKGFKHKDAVSDWENPSAAEPGCMQEGPLMFALFLRSSEATSLEKPVTSSYTLLSLLALMPTQDSLRCLGQGLNPPADSAAGLRLHRRRSTRRSKVNTPVHLEVHQLPASRAWEHGLRDCLQPTQTFPLLENRQ